MHTPRFSLAASSDFDCFSTDPLFEVDCPEKRLLCAILKRAIEDFALPDRMIINKENFKRISKIKGAAEKWLYDFESMEIGSIRWILENISNDAAEAHKSIIKLITSDFIGEWLKLNCVTHRVYPIFRQRSRIPPR